jgi:hypothetical protein
MEIQGFCFTFILYSHTVLSFLKPPQSTFNIFIDAAFTYNLNEKRK